MTSPLEDKLGIRRIKTCLATRLLTWLTLGPLIDRWTAVIYRPLPLLISRQEGAGCCEARASESLVIATLSVVAYRGGVGWVGGGGGARTSDIDFGCSWARSEGVGVRALQTESAGLSCLLLPWEFPVQRIMQANYCNPHTQCIVNTPSRHPN